MRGILFNFAVLRYKVTILFLLLTLFSCRETAPVAHKKMVDVMTDVMLLEGGSQAQYNFGNVSPNAWKRDYVFILKKHNLDTAIFRKSMVYLEKNPEEFSKILEEVITKLQKIEVQKNIPKP